MLTEKEAIKDSYYKIKNYAETGRLFKISRQRVFQIVSGYKNSGRNGREHIYEKIPALCEICQKLSPTIAHHKDFNNLNDFIENIIFVCYKCHVNLHKGQTRKHPKQYPPIRKCIICDRVLCPKIGNVSGKMCGSCHLYTKRKKRTIFRVRFFEKKNTCVDCGSLFDKSNPYFSNQRCRRCYFKNRWKINPKYKEYSHHYYKYKKYYSSII